MRVQNRIRFGVNDIAVLLMFEAHSSVFSPRKLRFIDSCHKPVVTHADLVIVLIDKHRPHFGGRVFRAVRGENRLEHEVLVPVDGGFHIDQIDFRVHDVTIRKTGEFVHERLEGPESGRPRQDRIVPVLLKKLVFSPIVAVQGARQTGKTFLVWELLKKPLPGLEYVTLDELKRLVDQKRIAGKFLLLGSTEFSRLNLIRESLTGRMSRVRMFPMNIPETLELPPSATKSPVLLNEKPRVSRREVVLYLERDAPLFPKVKVDPELCLRILGASLERKMHPWVLQEQLSQRACRDDRTSRLFYYRSPKGRFLHLVVEDGSALSALKIVLDEGLDRREFEILKAFRTRNPSTPAKLFLLGSGRISFKKEKIEVFPWESLG